MGTDLESVAFFQVASVLRCRLKSSDHRILKN